MAQVTTVLVGVELGPGTQLPGDWVLEDLNHADVQEIGKLATEHYGARTAFFGVINAESKKGTGVNYRLSIQATDMGKPCVLEAIANLSNQGNKTVICCVKLE